MCLTFTFTKLPIIVCVLFLFAEDRQERVGMGGRSEERLSGDPHQWPVSHRPPAHPGHEAHDRQAQLLPVHQHHPPGGHQHPQGQEEETTDPRAPGGEALPPSLQRERPDKEEIVHQPHAGEGQEGGGQLWAFIQ